MTTNRNIVHCCKCNRIDPANPFEPNFIKCNLSKRGNRHIYICPDCYSSTVPANMINNNQHGKTAKHGFKFELDFEIQITPQLRVEFENRNKEGYLITCNGMKSPRFNSLRPVSKKINTLDKLIDSGECNRPERVKIRVFHTELNPETINEIKEFGLFDSCERVNLNSDSLEFEITNYISSDILIRDVQLLTKMITAALNNFVKHYYSERAANDETGSFIMHKAEIAAGKITKLNAGFSAKIKL